MAEINFAEIEKKWQDAWEKEKVFEVSEKSEKEKYYVMEMFPYPSGEGLHMGHAFNYVIGDVYARYKIFKGFNVLHPMGYDALGLPAENAAIEAGVHPESYTNKAIKNYIEQQKMLGLSYDWNRMINSADSSYYKWDQWIFLKMLEKGLAYRKKAPVNWCRKCNTVLANEQVHNGKCWRHEDVEVEVKHLEQWFLKITDYVDELLDKIDDLDWPERTKTMQKHWIGKSYGTEIEFEINSEKWSVFTTRPDTIYGVTFMVVSAQHERLMELVTEEKKEEVKKFLKKLKSVSEKELEEMEKEGVFTGSYAVNPLTNEKVPVYAGNFVLAEYGSGMVMAVPAHDQRDFEFAKKYNIPIKIVIQPMEYEITSEKMARAFTGEGKLVNSEKFDGWDNKEAIDEITKFLKEKNLGRSSVQFKLRDWLISRQRYWGTPIPVIYCNECGIVPVPENELPVELPKNVKFGKGNPLETNEEFVKVRCPMCGSNDARRETDTMDTFVNSSWYFLRYCDPKNSSAIFDKKKVKYWMPIDTYIGGKEHATMHLIYFRFYTKFLRDLGLLDFGEPAKKLFHQGMLHGEGGIKMSKSKGNVVNPDKVSKKYGIDTARLFLLSLASPDRDRDWSEKGIQGTSKFIKRVWEFFEKYSKADMVSNPPPFPSPTHPDGGMNSETASNSQNKWFAHQFGNSSKRLESKLNKAIKEISENIEDFRYNLAVIKVRQLFFTIEEEKEISKKDLESFVKIFSVFCPHLAEEFWERIGNERFDERGEKRELKGESGREQKFVCLSSWPFADESKIDEELERVEKIMEKTIEDVNHIIGMIEKEVSKVYIYVVPGEIENFDVGVLSDRFGKQVEIFANNDKGKYDPEAKARKAKPGKPGIYLE